MIAAAKVGRDMIYYTFSNEEFERSMNEHYEKLVQKKATVGEAILPCFRELFFTPYPLRSVVDVMFIDQKEFPAPFLFRFTMPYKLSRCF